MKISNFTKITLLLLALMTMMSNVAIITALPHFREVFNDKNIELLSRLMLTMPSIVIALLSPYIGKIINKYGKIKSALFGLLLFSISGSAGLWLNSLYLILFSRALLGISVSILMIVTTSLIGDYFSGDDRAKYMGLQNASTAIGGIFFVASGGVLSDIGWRAPFGIYLVGFFLIPMIFVFLHEVKSTTKPTDIDNKTITKNPHIYLLAFLQMVLFFIMPTQMPFLVMGEFHASGTLTGLIISCAFLSNALGSLIFYKLKKRFSYGNIYLIGLSIMAIGFLGIGSISNVYFFCLTSATMGFGAGIMITNVVTWMLSTTTFHTRVKASSFLTSSFFFGQFCSPFVSVPLVLYFGVQHFFSIMGIFVGSLVVSGVIYKKIKGVS